MKLFAMLILFALMGVSIGAPVTVTKTTHITVNAAGATGSTARPSYNTGNGFYVLNGKLYDPTGVEFKIKGVDRTHYDSNSGAGIVHSNANTVRIFIGTQYGQTWPGLATIVQNDHINNHELAIPTLNYSTTQGATTCSSSTAALTGAVNDWIGGAKSSFTPLNRWQMVNIANEWGPSNSTVWRDSYITAIATMRSNGYTGALLVDSGGCGQDMDDLINYSTAVFNSDSQKNIVFSLHIYGQYPTSAVAGNIASLRTLANSAGMTFIVGEFGPGRNIGPSPTNTTPAQIIVPANNNNIGWLAWAWDDNNLNGAKADDTWFSMTYGNTGGVGYYQTSADLTIFGTDVVLNSSYGLQATAVKPSW